MSTEAKDAGIKAYAEAMAAQRQPRAPYPRWTTTLNGRIYRPTMRLAHRLGFCFPADVLVESGAVWCHWCGMRGKR